jgi:hypothetical protein
MRLDQTFGSVIHRRGRMFAQQWRRCNAKCFLDIWKVL